MQRHFFSFFNININKETTTKKADGVDTDA